ncbi:non-heme iron oxygenase ferredoxin subunit [Sporichthya sp.]|uniref:non-heme iron oxygenase ferredoxin subunit n=1 Tax=Sporichthya sp. TaxID=65475 RepID=UPI00185C7EB5|nr:non-heme iron oxygenase ferredoxin subunit [Sporichthya sp.]MBA3744389.1 non-heme iron oxygenase ferredoxin subunit [Sporichthya sp.]
MHHHVAALDDLLPGSLRRVEVAGVPVCLVRVEGGDVYAIGDECSHEDIELSDGDLEGCEVMCPAHGSCFDVRTGIPDGLPATAPVPTYPVRVDAGEVFIEIGD